MFDKPKSPEGPDGHALGDALRSRRKALGLNMQHVADGAGLSIGFISQVERGLTAPSLSSLAAIAGVLGLPVSAFLDPPEPSGATTHAGDRESYAVLDEALRYERLSTRFEGSQLHSVIVHEPPGRRAEPMRHQGEEIFFVLSGGITVEIEGQAHILGPGDSIHFDSTKWHATWNHTEVASKLLWCGTLDLFGDAAHPEHPPA